MRERTFFVVEANQVERSVTAPDRGCYTHMSFTGRVYNEKELREWVAQAWPPGSSNATSRDLVKDPRITNIAAVIKRSGWSILEVVQENPS